MLRVGLPALCIIAALCGAFLGGASRYFYKQFQTWNKLRKRKTALFGNGWFDSDRYIGPNHHTVVVKKKESKKKKEAEKKGKRTGYQGYQSISFQESKPFQRTQLKHGGNGSEETRMVYIEW